MTEKWTNNSIDSIVELIFHLMHILSILNLWNLECILLFVIEGRRKGHIGMIINSYLVLDQASFDQKTTWYRTWQ